MSIRLILVNKLDFEEAQPNIGYVYGYAAYGTLKKPVYVSLGNEAIYRRNRGDDPNTSYRLFFCCTIYYAETDKDLDNQIYSGILEQQAVKILC